MANELHLVPNLQFEKLCCAGQRPRGAGGAAAAAAVPAVLPAATSLQGNIAEVLNAAQEVIDQYEAAFGLQPRGSPGKRPHRWSQPQNTFAVFCA